MSWKPMLTAAMGIALMAVAQKSDSPEALLGAALHQQEIEGNCKEAIRIYQRVLQQKGAAKIVAARAQMGIASCQEKLGSSDARASYEAVVSRYGDQPEVVAQARARLAGLGGGGVASADVRDRQLLGGLGFDKGSPSHDGRFWTYSRDGLQVLNTETRQARRVLAAPTAKGEYISESSISPDGKRIAYLYTKDDSDGELRIVNIDGTNNRLLLKEPGTQPIPTDWSSDGRQIAAFLYTGDTTGSLGGQVALISAADGSKRVLYSTKRRFNPYDIMPFSPDGRYLAFLSAGTIYVLPIAGGEPISAVSGPGTGQLIGFAPDGRLVFLSDRSGSTGMWAIRIMDGHPMGEPELVRKDIGQQRVVGLSRSGAYFYFLNNSSNEIYTAEFDAAGKLLSGPSALPSRFVGVNTIPDYSKDGQFLAYVSGPAASASIRIRTLATGQERTIPKPAGGVGQLRWYPDGKAILVSGGNGQGPGFYKVDAQTGTSSPVVTDGISTFASTNPMFSPDGKHLYYATMITPQRSGLMRMDMATGAREEILRPSDDIIVRLFSLSPDGSEMVVSGRKDSNDFLYRVPVSGGEPKVFFDYPKSELSRAWGALSWTADGKAVFFHHGVGVQDELLRIPLSGGSPEKLLTTGIMHKFAVHPDGRQIAWEAHTSSTEVWVMENLFPKARELK